MYKKDFERSKLTYSDVAHELGCCELTARKKINGQTKITKAERVVLDHLFEGENETCTISRHSR